MRAMRLLLFTLLLAGCATSAPARAPGSATTLPLPIAAFLDAFNRHDVTAMSDVVTPDIEWASATGTELVAETRGKEALERAMRDYFKSLPDVRSELEGASTSPGRFIALRERVRWTDKQGRPKTQSALAVYELSFERSEAGHIRRVTYYPSEP